MQGCFVEAIISQSSVRQSLCTFELCYSLCHYNEIANFVFLQAVKRDVIYI